MMKQLYAWLLKRTGNSRRAARVLALLWLFSFFLLSLGQAERGVLVFWGGVIPCGVLFYCWCVFVALPAARAARHPYRAFALKALLFLLLSPFPVALLAQLLIREPETAVDFGILNLFLQTVITLPLALFFFRRRRQQEEELLGLKKELGRSTAEFDFLRSQINPHFLFNALNTIYGLSLEEGAERTSESVEKLGSMMRFMLNENLQERIPLAREIEYLNNFIYLQRLRTAGMPGLRIEALVPDAGTSHEIAPMLLIPFVENAFKHGLSFREPSEIRLSLEIREGTVYFAVHNSKHRRASADPERGKSGIGLSNVRQRLELLYPGKHGLTIQETTRDFSVHLRVVLGSGPEAETVT